MAVVTHDTQYVGLVLVSHSGEIVAGLAGLVGQVAGPDVPIATAGGMPDGSFGTDGGQVLDVLRSAANGAGAGAVVLMDLGSSVLAVRAAVRSLDAAAAAEAASRAVQAESLEESLALGSALLSVESADEGGEVLDGLDGALA